MNEDKDKFSQHAFELARVLRSQINNHEPQLQMTTAVLLLASVLVDLSPNKEALDANYAAAGQMTFDVCAIAQEAAAKLAAATPSETSQTVN